MKYNEIAKVLEREGLDLIDTEITLCVQASVNAVVDEFTDDEFDAICRFVRHVWDEVDIGYTQRIADIVIDLITDTDWGYRKDYILTMDDIENYNIKDIALVMELFYNSL